MNNKEFRGQIEDLIVWAHDLKYSCKEDREFVLSCYVIPDFQPSLNKRIQAMNLERRIHSHNEEIAAMKAELKDLGG